MPPSSWPSVPPTSRSPRPLLLLLLLLCWRGAGATPLPCVRAPERAPDSDCVARAHDLLRAVRRLVRRSDLYSGFNCTEMPAKVRHTATLSTCAPANSLCSDQQNTRLNEGECLVNIRADLEHYGAVLDAYNKSYPTSDLTEVLDAIKDTKEKCVSSNPEQKPPSEDMNLCKSAEAFNNRVCLCQLAKGFQQRAVTINRALGYLAAGENRT
ncbi:interleukin-12 subunit alpha [Denticeps clupeoides]|uniref:interleukin-12 subunit alpha n=1 Tax=Denticeps clupeoides TaxID=299321 RepID=UPI0010A46C60|nr:uncharacterized protein LOC114769616 [Denticeps clupeoides]